MSPFIALAVGSLCFLLSTTGAFAYSRQWDWVRVAPTWAWGFGHFIVGYPLAYVSLLFLRTGYSTLGTGVTVILLAVVTRSWIPVAAGICATASEFVLMWQWRMAEWPIMLALQWNAWIAAGMFFWAWRARTRPARELAAGRCPSCGYSIKGLSSTKCPECGSLFQEDKVVPRPTSDARLS